MFTKGNKIGTISNMERNKKGQFVKGYMPRNKWAKGHIPWNKGVKGYSMHSENWKKELSRRMKGNKFSDKRVPWNKGKKIHHTVWNKGKKGEYHFSEEAKEKMSKARLGNKSHTGLLGRKHSEETKRKIGESHRGEKHYRWNPNREEVMKNKRNDGGYRQWMLNVKKRDKGRCRIDNKDCSGYCVVHHILSWAEHPELRYEINNGITLCQAHHPRKRAEEKRLVPFFTGLVSVSKD